MPCLSRLTESVRSGVAAETAATSAVVLPPGVRPAGSVRLLVPTPFQSGRAVFGRAGSYKIEAFLREMPNTAW